MTDSLSSDHHICPHGYTRSLCNLCEQPSTDQSDKRDAARYRMLKRHADTISFYKEVRLMKDGQPLYVTMIGANELDEAIDSMEQP